MKVCRIDPAQIRLGEGEFGTRVASLVPPGNTGPAWNCLQSWATYRNDISLVVDEAVFRSREN